MIQTLIDKRDNAEIVRDKIAAILVAEVESQKGLARTAGKDAELWDLRVYTERSDPWQEFQPRDKRDCDPQVTPIVNVGFDSSSFDKAGSDPIEQQKVVGTFHIDVYGYGESGDAVDGPGHDRGDKLAAFEAQRAARLVRNILMAAEYVSLGMTGLVWDRWVASMQQFQPAHEERQPVERVIGLRITFEVTFTEFSPQYEGQTFEGATATVKRASDGRVYLVASFTPPPS